MAVRSVAEHTLARLARNCRISRVEPFNSRSTLLREARLQSRRRTSTWRPRRVKKTTWACTPPPMGVPGHTRASRVTAANSAISTSRTADLVSAGSKALASGRGGDAGRGTRMPGGQRA
jgi:hypothetical protein